MLWVFLAISTHFIWALTNVADKYVVTNKVKNPYVLMVWLWLLAILLVVLIPFVNFYIPETRLFIWLILAGILAFAASFPYIKAMQLEEVTRINIWWNLIPLFTLVIAWFTIGQKLNGLQLVALVILLTGAVIGSLHVRGQKLVLSKAVVWLGLSCLLYSFYAVIFAHVSQSVPFIVGFIWVNIIGFICALFVFLLPTFRKEFTREIKKVDGKLFSIVFSVSMLEHLAQFLNVWALSIGLVALIFAMEGFQTIFVFVLVIIISLFKPKLLKEELDKRNILLKLLALVFMVVGVAVLYLS